MKTAQKKALLDINQDVRGTCQLIREKIYAGDLGEVELYAEALISLSHRITNEVANIREANKEGK
jgi:hypothetical protein